MKRYEVIGNCRPAPGMPYSTSGRVCGEYFTVGAAKKAALELMRDELESGDPEYISFDVDDGRGHIVFTARPSDVRKPSLKDPSDILFSLASSFSER